MKSPDHIQPIKYVQTCHTMLRSLYIWVWSCLVALQKKLFSRPQRFLFQKKLFLKCYKVPSNTDTLSREIKHPLSKSPTRPKKRGGINPPFFNTFFLVFPPRNKKKAQNFLAASPREFFVKKGMLLTLRVLFCEIRYLLFYNVT